MEPLEEALRTAALEFGARIVAREFESAHQLLAPQLAADISPGDLEHEFDEMIVHFDTEDAAPVPDALQQVDEDDFGQWIYMPIEGDGELEAITLALQKVDGHYRITDIEWGKQWKGVDSN
ncbi:MAG: hypothetical protein VYA55_20195 [Pseudomonadota bacterium]|nr:hypothetical protein [Pseudomonadota bacterium]